MRMLKPDRRRRMSHGRIRRSHPTAFSDVFSDIFGDEYELGDDVSEVCIGGAPPDKTSAVPSGNGG